MLQNPTPATQPDTTPAPTFPLQTLPEPVRTYVATAAREIRVAPEMIAAPFLAFAGATIGNQLSLQIGPGWIERPALWIVLVAPTGTGKSPAIRAARRPVEILQQRHIASNPTAILRPRHEYASSQTGMSTAEWLEAELSKQLSIQPPLPTPPIGHLFTTDNTFDALVELLKHSPGLTIHRDELYGLVRALSRHGGDERQRYLSLWSSEAILTHRIGESASWLPHPVVSIVGGIQPSLVQKMYSRDHDGLVERFIPVHIENRSRYWDESESTAPAADPEPIAELLTDLRLLDTSANGHTLTRTATAGRHWASWFNHNVDLSRLADPACLGFYNKLPAHVARLALILHSLQNPDRLLEPLDHHTMSNAIELGEYFRTHIQRIVPILVEKPRHSAARPTLEDRILRILAETHEPEGWLGRTALLIALGRPDKTTFDLAIQHLIATNQVEPRTTPAARRRPATSHYRLPRKPQE